MAEFEFARKEGILEEAYEDDEEAQRMVELKHNLPGWEMGVYYAHSPQSKFLLF